MLFMQQENLEEFIVLMVTNRIDSKDSIIYYKIVFLAAEPAGPLFTEYDCNNDPKDAADNVQCIHTSIQNVVYNCHQDWLMG